MLFFFMLLSVSFFLGAAGYWCARAVETTRRLLALKNLKKEEEALRSRVELLEAHIKGLVGLQREMEAKVTRGNA